jgi:ketosteroid isomerase-like protein
MVGMTGYAVSDTTTSPDHTPLSATPTVDKNTFPGQKRLRSNGSADVVGVQKETKTMPTADEVVNAMCQSYASAVNASDAMTYATLCTHDAIRMPPGAYPEYGPEQIRQGEQADYDVAKWHVQFTPRDALAIAADWTYGIADVEVSMVAHADGQTSHFRLTVACLLQRQPAGTWLIQRQMWNRKPEQS